jgi:REP element-mobilizing transposase RayT
MRTIRQIVPGVVYHLIARFVDRQWLITSDTERERYLTMLAHALSVSDWRCLAYAIMSSHIHFAMLAGIEPLGAWTKRVHSPFARWLNTQHERVGQIFTRGPKVIAVPPAKVGEVIAYIHNNPVKARVVKRAGASSWTSHRAYAGYVTPPQWLHVDEGLALAGFDDPRAFDEWVAVTPGDPCYVKLGRIRKAARTVGALEVGTPTGGGVSFVPLVSRPFGAIRVDPRVVVGAAAAALRISTLDVISRSRAHAVVGARRVAVHASAAFGISRADIAAALALHPSAVTKIASRVLEAELVGLCERVVENVERVTGAIQHRPHSVSDVLQG